MAADAGTLDYEKYWRRLQQVGLNAYEARSYLVLVGHPRFKALELAARARVPRQKIYEVLDSLVDKGFAQVVQEKTKLFSAVEPGLGRVVVAIEYLVKPADAVAFKHLMQHEARSSRLRNGALSWHLLQDINQPGRFTELIVDGSWPDHLRRFDRSNAAERGLRERKRAFHIGPSKPNVTRHLLTP